MNDRFKFRIFYSNKMVYPNSYENIESIYECLKQQIMWDSAINVDLKFNHIANNLFFMQCTGLKDKNGKLIYEGDIVKIKTHYNHLVCDDYEYDCESEKGYSLFKIIYDDDIARFGAERIKCVKWETHHYSLDYVPYNHKVIGNIYENKSLLESEG